LLEPDHSATYGIGVRKAWRHGTSLTAARVEIANYQPSTLLRHRGEGGVYAHNFTRQGHTQRGQLLGTGISVGSTAGTSVILEQFNASGFTRVGWTQFAVQDLNGFGRRPSVEHVVRIERLAGPEGGSVRLRWALDGI